MLKFYTPIKQSEELITQLGNKPYLAVIDSIQVPEKFNEGWIQISKKLNELGPAAKNVQGWQKVWRDFRHTLFTKLKLKDIDAYEKEEGIINISALSNLEKKAFYTILEVNKPFHPELSMQEIRNLGDCTVVLDDDDLPTTSANAIAKAKSKINSKSKTNKNSQLNGSLVVDVAMQNGFLNGSNKTLIEVKDFTEKLYKEIEINNRYQKKLLEIEENRLKVLERQHHMEQDLFWHKIQFKTKELEMLQRKMELLLQLLPLLKKIF